MSRSRRRGSKDVPEEEPPPEVSEQPLTAEVSQPLTTVDEEPTPAVSSWEGSDELGHLPPVVEERPFLGSESHDPETSLEGTAVAPNEAPARAHRTRRRGSKDPPEEEPVSFPSDPATSSSPPRVAEEVSEDTVQEAVQERPEEKAMDSPPRAARSRRRGSKDVPEEEEPQPSESFTHVPRDAQSMYDITRDESPVISSVGPRLTEHDMDSTQLLQPDPASSTADLRQPDLLPEGQEHGQELPSEIVADDTLRGTADAGSDSPLALMDAEDNNEIERPSSPITETLEESPALADVELPIDNVDSADEPSSSKPSSSRQIVSKRASRGARPNVGAIAHKKRSSIDKGIEDSPDDSGSEQSWHGNQDRANAKDIYDDDDEDSEMKSDSTIGKTPVMANLSKFDELTGMVEMNSCGMLSSMCSAVTWVFLAAATLLALTWHYLLVEVTHLAENSAKAAVDGSCLESAEVLRSAVTLMRTLDIGFRMGIMASIWTNFTNTTDYESTFDYVGYKRVVEPFFKVVPGLREVELIDTPEQPVAGVAPGSILAARSRLGGVEIRSDRSDCNAIRASGESGGCTLEPQLANETSWYESCRGIHPHAWSAVPIRGLWVGPEFSRNLPHEGICDELCWSPTFSLAARISGHIDPRVAYSTQNEPYLFYRSFVARVTMEATVFLDVLRTVQNRTRGEAVICTDDGTVVAAVDMALAQDADLNSGAIQMVKLWQLAFNWSSGLTENVVREGSGGTETHSGYLVSVWKLNSPFDTNYTGVMDKLGEKLRIVVAIHQDAFADTTINSMSWYFIIVSLLPVVFVVLMSFANLYYRFCVSSKHEQEDLTMEEIQRLARSRTTMKKSIMPKLSTFTRHLSRKEH